MPELPEVELTTRNLHRHLPGECIDELLWTWPNMLPQSERDVLASSLRGRLIESVSRRGKYLILKLSGNMLPKYLVFHLKMSGRLEFQLAGEDESPYIRIRLKFQSGAQLLFHDVRKFGRLYLLDGTDDFFSSLGPEPLSPSFKVNDLVSKLQRCNGRVKPFLLAQENLAGLGNIYADESLWKSGIHPLRKGRELSKHQISRLHQSIQKTLFEAIQMGGTDFGDHVVPGGQYQPKIYGRSGEACFECGVLVEKISVASRGTHFCPCCQPL